MTERRGKKKLNLYINYLFFFLFKKTMDHRNVEIIIIKFVNKTFLV